MAFVEFKNVYKRYKMGEVTITASDGVSFEVGVLFRTRIPRAGTAIRSGGVPR